jgi:hypothetical protein
VYFRSPTGAKVFVDDKYIGDAPTTYATREVTLRAYRMEPSGSPPLEGFLTPHLAPGRVVGAIFTLGILAAIRPLHYYIPDLVDATGTSSAVTSAITTRQKSSVKLYNLKTGEIAAGDCDANNECTLRLASGATCSGESVRENEGTTTTRAAAAATQGAGFGGTFGTASAGAAAGRDVQNSQHGVAMFKCPDRLINCTTTMDYFGPTGFGDCTDGRGEKYRVMFLGYTGP